MAKLNDRGFLDGILKTAAVTLIELILASKVGEPLLGGILTVTEVDLITKSVTANISIKGKIVSITIGEVKPVKKAVKKAVAKKK